MENVVWVTALIFEPYLAGPLAFFFLSMMSPYVNSKKMITRVQGICLAGGRQSELSLIRQIVSLVLFHYLRGAP